MPQDHHGQDMPDYAIVVPAYNEQHHLPLTLPAIRAAMAGVDARGELIVVDNNSSDRTAEVAQQHGARVVFEPVNQISRARNAGASAASAPVLVFVDADTELPAELLQAALAAVAEPECVGGGARVVMRPEPGFLARRLLGLWNLISRLLGLPAGCFFFCRRDAFDEVDGFSEAVYASEEIWLARRLKKWGRPRGMTMRVLPEAIYTSPRKTDRPGRLIVLLLVMTVFPFAPRFRGLCGYWYKRDDETPRPESA